MVVTGSRRRSRQRTPKDRHRSRSATGSSTLAKSSRICRKAVIRVGIKVVYSSGVGRAPKGIVRVQRLRRRLVERTTK